MTDLARRLWCALVGHRVDAVPLPWGPGLHLGFSVDDMTCRRCYRRVLWTVVHRGA